MEERPNRYNMKQKPTDNAAEQIKQRHRKNRLSSIKNELEGGRITTFDQIFAIITETRMSIEVGISFYAFRRKVKDPGEFTLNELMRLAALFDVKYDVIDSFIWNLIKVKSKSKIFHGE